MRLLADENIPDALIDELRAAGHVVSRPPLGTIDPDVISLAKKEGCILLTQDKDFANIILYPPKNFHGIIRIKIHPPIISDIVHNLLDLFSKFSQKELDKKLVILEEDGFRLR